MPNLPTTVAEVAARHEAEWDKRYTSLEDLSPIATQRHMDRGFLLADADRLRRVLGAILQWPANWNAPWEAEEEWRGDLELAKAALRGDPE